MPFTRQGRVKATLARAHGLVGRVLYVYGATGPTQDDCSGLTEYCWQAGGVQLPHNAAAQLEWCKPVTRQTLKPGDLAFYYSATVPTHVALVNDVTPHVVHVIQATDEERGVEMILMDAYTPALAFGRPSRKAA